MYTYTFSHFLHTPKHLIHTLFCPLLYTYFRNTSLYIQIEHFILFNGYIVFHFGIYHHSLNLAFYHEHLGGFLFAIITINASMNILEYRS